MTIHDSIPTLIIVLVFLLCLVTGALDAPA